MSRSVSMLRCAASLCLLVACSDDGGPSSTSDETPTSSETDGSASTETSASTTTGDGDGDSESGDGDGDPAMGDGDGDPATGDGDGEPATGDGDGDSGDGDGDSGDGDGDSGGGDGDGGDGDGDGSTGDGDGDGGTGDGDGDGGLCGNGALDPGEACDDGNGDPDDGCDASCAIECGFLCLEVGESCTPGFNAVQCASPGPPFGQPSAIPNTCQLATLSVDGNSIALSPETTIEGQPRHLDAMYTDANNDLFGFAGDTQDLESGSQLVSVDADTGELTPIGPSLGVWVMGAAMSDMGELWVTVFDTYELNETTEVRIARVDPMTGEFLAGPTLLTENDQPVTVWSIHVSDVAFRFDGAMFISANEPGPPPPEPLSRYLEVDPDLATVVSAVEGPADIYAAGIVFVGEEDQILAMDIRGADDIFILNLAAPPDLDETLLYDDPIETNSGTADLAGCAQLVQPQ